MKKRNTILVIFTSLLLAGCSNTTSGDNNKPKVSVPYSNLIRSSSSSTAVNTSTVKNENSPESSSSESSPVSESNPSSSIDYDTLVNDIADKVAEKLSSNSNSISEQNTSNNVSSSNSSEEDFTGTTKYSESYSENQPSQEPIKTDNSLAIAKIQNQITLYENEIKKYELEIDRLDTTIDECKRNQENLINNELAEAKVDLINAQKHKVWVYSEGSGFQQVADESVVKKAQEQINYYEDLISDYDDLMSPNIKPCKCQ